MEYFSTDEQTKSNEHHYSSGNYRGCQLNLEGVEACGTVHGLQKPGDSPSMIRKWMKKAFALGERTASRGSVRTSLLSGR